MSSEVPEGWRPGRFGQFLKAAQGGGTPPRDNPAYWGRDLPWASVKDVTSGAREPLEGITAEGLENSSSRRVAAGTNILAMRMAVGSVVRYGVDVAINQDLLALTPADSLDGDFLFHWLRHCSTHFADVATGTTVKGLRKDILLDWPIVLPPLDEQRRIAEVLRSVDVAITIAGAVLSQTLEAREHQLERLMALPGDMRPLADVCRLGGGYGFPIKHQGKRSGAYPFAKVSDMNRPGNETELVSAENYVDQADLKVLRAKPFPPGTTFFPKVGATLLTNKRRISSSEIIVDNNVMGAVPTAIESWFLFYAFNTIDMADYVQPGAVPSVNQGTVGKIMIPVPSREVQRDYVITMRDLDSAIEAQRATILSLRITKTAVSADLLSGSVRVPA
ncbi:restriction endonuclease subunit S [Brevundimonas aveniformis]|uniref:restriction endonuclease subunit S n=1 Tax=Brevundimonas aveniformis TaxID=370977 RepID=UPI00040FCA43|nr:restriction endonuclease subunit S [Brevundimonas aveniformis]